MKKLLLVVIMAGMFGVVSAQQNYKFGHINSQELIVLMPERDSAISRLESYGKELQEQVETMQVEFNTKWNTYQQKQATWGTSILEAKQKELQELQARIQEFQQTAQDDFQKMQGTVMRPVIEKATKAIEKVGKQEGFTYVFDISAGSIPYFNADQSIDLLPMVKKELNITKDAPAARPAAAGATLR